MPGKGEASLHLKGIPLPDVPVDFHAPAKQADQVETLRLSLQARGTYGGSLGNDALPVSLRADGGEMGAVEVPA